MADFPWDVVGHGISGVASIINTAQTNKNNLRIARETNEANRQMVEMQNKAAREEAEKAYQRSSAPNQVELMRSAGMSRAGAINALNGGGSYTPAPVNTSQDSAPQMQTADFSAFANMAQAITADKQMKQNEKLAKMQIKASSEAQKAQFEENEKQRKHDVEMKDIDTANQTQHDYIEYEKHKDNYNLALKRYNLDKDISDQLTPRQARVLDATVSKISAEANLTRTQENDLAYRIAEYQSKEYKTVRDAKNLLEGLQADFDYKITNKSFSDYLNENYDYDEKTGEYIPKQWQSNANKVQQGARVVWNTIFELIPVNVLLEALGGTVENVRAIKLLSKVK